MTPVEIKREYGDAVVTITTYSAAENAVGLGSGFIVDPSGVIVTCYHVVDGAYPAVVKLLNGASFRDIWVLGCDPAKDVAVIKVKGRGLPAVRLGNADAEVGERVVVIGNPKGLENTVSDGLLSGIRDMAGLNLLQISAPISPGSSGGPVFNLQGHVIGIAAATLKEGQNLNFCVPVKYAKPYVGVEPYLSLEDFSRGIRASGVPPTAAGLTLARSQFLQACVDPITDFYGVVHWLSKQPRTKHAGDNYWGWSPNRMEAFERIAYARARLEGLAPPDQELGSIRAGYLDVIQRVADGLGFSAIRRDGRKPRRLHVRYAEIDAAKDDIFRKGGLTELLGRIYLMSGRAPTDTAGRLPAVFDSLPAGFAEALLNEATIDSGLSELHSIAVAALDRQFGFVCNHWLPGVVVESVLHGHPAKEAGLTSGDVMVCVADTLPLRNLLDWYAFMAGYPVGLPFRLDILRAGQRMQLSGTLAYRSQ